MSSSSFNIDLEGSSNNSMVSLNLSESAQDEKVPTRKVPKSIVSDSSSMNLSEFEVTRDEQVPTNQSDSSNGISEMLSDDFELMSEDESKPESISKSSNDEQQEENNETA